MRAIKSNKYKSKDADGNISYRIRIDYELTESEYEKLLTSIIPKPKEIRNLLSGLELKKIVEFISEFFSISEADLKKRCRLRKYVLPRQCAMYLAKEHVDTSLNNIGHYFDGRDHATVLHSWKKVDGMQHGTKEDKNIFKQLVEAFDVALEKRPFDTFDREQAEALKPVDELQFRTQRGKKIIRDKNNHNVDKIDLPMRLRKPHGKSDYSMLTSKSELSSDGW